MNTKFGNFEVSDNGKGGAILSMSGVQIIQFPTTPWWNKDELLKRLNKNHKVVTQRISEKIGKVSVQNTIENVVTDYKELGLG